MRSSLLAVFLALAVRLAGAQVLEPPSFMEARLATGAFDEMCFELEARQSMRYAFDADAPLDFNLHWHRGGAVLYPIKMAAVGRLGGVFRSEQKQAYCLMWTNRARTAVSLRARIDRAD
jgi:hypothetical protein